MTDIERFAGMIEKSDRIVFFGGAGVSTESGLKDYRSKDSMACLGCLHETVISVYAGNMNCCVDLR